ncbi:hypothetical protein EDB81DRAFT_323848 [Dactylonectria macrodidyma]|uniref:Uncharacterized protein n=1 Tax=Dactylonectria macrodidyma TaxID=307937 RepID=A0A9P9JBQ9_9HYPO|nr:hypothetical protein EDB81DRAFT_323848 [Dactylonectria macrodidyma]
MTTAIYLQLTLSPSSSSFSLFSSFSSSNASANQDRDITLQPALNLPYLFTSSQLHHHYGASRQLPRLDLPQVPHCHLRHQQGLLVLRRYNKPAHSPPAEPRLPSALLGDCVRPPLASIRRLSHARRLRTAYQTQSAQKGIAPSFRSFALPTTSSTRKSIYLLARRGIAR